MIVPIPKRAYVKCQECKWNAELFILETRAAFFLKAAEEHAAASKGCDGTLVVLPTQRRPGPPEFVRGRWRMYLQPWNWYCLPPPLANSLTAKIRHFGLRGDVTVTEETTTDRIRFTGFDADSVAG